MQQQSTEPITEDDKRRLTEYLIERVSLRISGRDGEEVVDMSPSRALYAGVLQAPRPMDVRAVERAMPATDAPRETAIGLDFRVLPHASDRPVRLRVATRWSHYYAVFPTWEQAMRSNAVLLTEVGGASPQAARGASTEEEGYGVTEAEESDTADDSSATFSRDEGHVRDEVRAEPGTVVLPRVFRRVEVAPPMIDIVVPSDGVQRYEVGKSDLQAALDHARGQILSDARVWRHLDSPGRHERALGDANLLASADAYAKALRAAAGPAVEPPSWSVALHVDSRPDPSQRGAIRVQVVLANLTGGSAPEDSRSEDTSLQERALFDASLAVDIDGGALLPFDFLLAPKDYRSSKSKVPAKGINCSAKWNAELPNRLETETLPVFRQPLYRTRDALEVPFEKLDTPDATGELERIADEMEAYAGCWDDFLQGEGKTNLNAEERAACARDRAEFVREISSFRLGIEALRRDRQLAQAFQWMNRAFVRLGSKSGGRLYAWRLFQVGFIVSQLPALAVRELPETADEEYAKALRSTFEEVAVLWFPTGGGKTEAYLGLIAVALLYDRLRGKTRGVCAWMRFPLRMLSLQQLDRLTRVIAVLNELRVEEPALTVGDPFAVGYYVGNAVAPNSLSSEEMQRYERDQDLCQRSRLIRKCPFCGSRVDVLPMRDTWRLAHVCSNEDCFSNTSASLGPYRGSLPLCVVDNEIYRYLPSVLVGTIDKLAIVGHNRSFVHLVRGVSQRCPVHGYASYDQCIERRTAGCNIGKRNLERLQAVHDPGPSLLIQDELHLLRAELGVFDGHYEGLLKYLGGRAYLPPKVLGATATIEAYDVHAFHIYLSRARRFPQPSWLEGESFYATSTPTRHRRFYVGILSHTRAVEDAALRVLALYWEELRQLQSDLRRAASVLGRPDATNEMILDTLRLYDFSLAYVNRKATGGSIIHRLGAIDQQMSSEKLGSLRCRLLTGDQSSDEIAGTLDQIEKERADTGEDRLNVVAATNLISHGVDLERINMMVVCGVPSHYAEYVQSTSRAARSHPGIVFVCFRSRDLREHSQYELFPAMHQHMDRLIEATAVNRFASFAPQRTVPGLLIGVLLCDVTPALYGSKIVKPLDHIPTLQTALGLRPAAKSGTQSSCIDADALEAAIEEIIGVDRVRPPATRAQIDNLRERVKQVVGDQIAAIGRTMDMGIRDALHPLTSFRDVDEGIDFGSIGSAALVTRLRAR